MKKTYDSMRSIFIDVYAERETKKEIKEEIAERKEKIAKNNGIKKSTKIRVSEEEILCEMEKLGQEEIDKKIELHKSSFSSDSQKNYSNKLRKILTGLYYYINGIIPNKNDLEIDANPITRSVVYVLMRMDSSHKVSFISKIRNKRFEQITIEEIEKYIDYVFNELYDIDLSVPEDFKNMFDGLLTDDGKPFSEEAIADQYREHWHERLDENREEIIQDVLFKHNENETIAVINENIKNAIGKFYPRSLIDNIPFPKLINCPNNLSTFENLYDFIEVKRSFSNSAVVILDEEEKQFILDLLVSDVNKVINDWTIKVSDALHNKTHDEDTDIRELVKTNN